LKAAATLFQILEAGEKRKASMSHTLVKAIRLALMTATVTLGLSARAGEIGHFNGGFMNIRDYVMPDAGTYVAIYNYFYTTGQLNDSNGDAINSVTIKPGPAPAIERGINVDVNLYALAPTLIWVTDLKSLGIRYGALISPTFVNANLNAEIEALRGRGGSVSAGGFGVGDLFFQPVWLGKSLKHFDFTFAYGFYAPVGRYDTQTVRLPVVGTAKVENGDNLGYGFWTNQFQGSIAWYPMTNKATAVVTALTYETNGKKEGFDLTPGDNLTLNWGISQFLPLKKDKTLLAEVGPAGYDTWQITHDSGSAASSTLDQVHTVGGQLGLTYVPWFLSVTVHGFYEYYAKDRFQGGSFGVSVAKKF
jgi:hypothetical protein